MTRPGWVLATVTQRGYVCDCHVHHLLLYTLHSLSICLHRPANEVIARATSLLSTNTHHPDFILTMTFTVFGYGSLIFKSHRPMLSNKSPASSRATSAASRRNRTTIVVQKSTPGAS